MPYVKHSNLHPHLTWKIQTSNPSCLSSVLTINSLKYILFFFLFFLFSFRLPFQTVSNEQILSTETILESSKTWRQQYHWHSPPQQTSCKKTSCFVLTYVSKVEKKIFFLHFNPFCLIACCGPWEEAEWVWEP